MRVKRNGVYAEATPYVKRGGVYVGASVHVKSDGVYQADSANRLTLDGSTILAYDGVTPLTLRGMCLGSFYYDDPAIDPAQYAAWGCNFYRLVLPRWWGWYPEAFDFESRTGDASQGYLDPAMITFCATMIRAIHASGGYVLLEFDSDCGANGNQGQNERDYCSNFIGQGTGHATPINFWTYPEQLVIFTAMGRYLLENLPSDAQPDMIGCLAEPQQTDPVSLKATYAGIMDNWLEVKPDAIFAIGGQGYQPGNMQDVLFADRTNIVYEFNLLSGSLETPSGLAAKIKAATQFRDNNNVPVLCDQLGTRTSTDPTQIYINGGYSICNANDIHWTVWQSRMWPDSNGDYAFYDGYPAWTLKTANRDRLIVYAAQTYAALEAAAVAAATAESAVLFYAKPAVAGVFPNLKQDSAGTINVTAFGDRVGLWSPVVGAGLTLQQPTGGNLRPTLFELPNNGRPVMLFDAATTILNGSVPYFSSGSQMTVIVSGIPGDVASTQDMLSAGHSTGTPKWPRLGASSAKVATCVWQTDTTTATITGTTPTADSPIVMSCTRDGSGDKKLFCNGAQDGATDATVDGAIANFTRLRVGGSSTNTANFSGPIGVICVKVGTMADANRQAIERFAAYHVGGYYQL